MLENITSKFGFETPEQKRNTALLGLAGVTSCQALAGAVLGFSGMTLLSAATTVGFGAAILANPLTATIAGVAIIVAATSIIAGGILGMYAKQQNHLI